MKDKRFALLPITAAALLAVAGSAQALEFHGYFRSGIGWGSKDGGQTCFGLPGVPGNGNFRLGNECGTYGELQFDHNLFDGKDGVKFDYHIMLGYVRSGPDRLREPGGRRQPHRTAPELGRSEEPAVPERRQRVDR